MDQIQTRMIATVILASVLFTNVAVRAADDSTNSPEVPPLLGRAVGCLVTTDYVRHDLEQLGLKPGDSAWIRYHVGSIPGLTPTPGEYYVAVYTQDESRGWLLIADHRTNGSFVAIRNAYQLKREGARWTADEGNGGLATYKAMSKFAASLFQTPRYRVRLAPGSCTAKANP
jgi:hypothetical protein